MIAPAIGSWLGRWTNDESAHVDARKHLDDTVTALARAGITARGETGADDPLQATDDGLREFAANEIVFVTKPGTNTDWVEEGVIETATKRYAIPVTHIALPPTDHDRRARAPVRRRDSLGPAMCALGAVCMLGRSLGRYRQHRRQGASWSQPRCCSSPAPTRR